MAFHAVFIAHRRVSPWFTDERKADECQLTWLDAFTLLPDDILTRPVLKTAQVVPVSELQQ